MDVYGKLKSSKSVSIYKFHSGTYIYLSGFMVNVVAFWFLNVMFFVFSITLSEVFMWHGSYYAFFSSYFKGDLRWKLLHDFACRLSFCQRGRTI